MVGGGDAQAPVARGRGALPGITAGRIKIGFWLLEAQATCSGVGVDPNQGEGRCGAADEQEIDAIVDYVNAHGGVAGRTMEAVIFYTDLAASSYAAQAEAACTYFTEDNTVMMVVSEGQRGRPYMAQCLAERGIPFIEPGFWPFDDRAYEALDGYIYQPHRVRPERWTRTYVDALAGQGFLTEQSRIGLVRFDAGPFTRVTNRVIKPRLAQHGLKLTDEAVLKTPPTVSAWSDMNAELSSAILRFKQKGIDRVLFFSVVSEIETFFYPQAESQNFRPRYGVNSLGWPSLQADIAPAEQLRGAVGIGWSPFFDVSATEDPGGGRAAHRCKKILTDAGLDGGAGRNNKCDSILFLQAMINRADRLSIEGFQQAVESLGSGFQPSASFSTTFGPDRYDGPASFRYTFFDQGCTCFRYRGRLRALP